MSDRTFNISFRPKTFDDLIGQSRMVRLIRKHYESGREPSAWMFIGESGAGKTTIARILALSLQCTHQERFGNPCIACRKKRSTFDITEINASKISGVNEIEQVIVGADYSPRSPSRRRVYIFDEMQGASSAAQNLLLKPFEDGVKTTVFIICTTDPRKILRTLRRRCLTYTIPSFGVEGVENLVKQILEKEGSDQAAEPLVEALLEHGVTSAGFIAMAVEKYLAGDEAEIAAQVGMDSALNTMQVCRCVVKGDWETTRKLIANATPEDNRALRASVAGYLKTILLDTGIDSSRGKKIVDSIKELSAGWGDETAMAYTTAVLYNICIRFK